MLTNDDPTGGGTPDPNQPPANPTAPKRYNTTLNWQDPLNPPSPGDPYWAEWIAANPDYRGQGYNGPDTPPGYGPTSTGNGPTVGPGTGGGGGGGGTGGGGHPDPTSTIFDPFPNPTPPRTRPPTPDPAPTFNAPRFAAPPAFQYDKFQAPDKFTPPSLDDAMRDPGYQFERDEGNRALTNAASAKGLLRSGNTLEDFARWNSNFAQTRYNDVYNRRANEYEQNFNNLFSTWNANRENAINTYTTNYGVSRDVFDRNADAATAEFAPKLHQWDVLTNLNQRNHELDSDHDFQTWLQQYRIWDDQRRWRYGVLDNERTRGMPTGTSTTFSA